MASFRPDRVVMTVKGQILHGFAPGTFITAEMTTDRFTLEKGADGEAAWMESLDDSGKVTVQLMQASGSNDDLNAISVLGELVEIQVADYNGNTKLQGTARIMRQPNAEFSNQFVPREWTFMCERLDITHGGVTVR